MITRDSKMTMVGHKFQGDGLAIGVDLGGHHLRGAVIDAQGEVLSQKEVPTDSTRNLDRVLDQINVLCEELKVAFASQKILGACIGIPGFMNHSTGDLTSSPNFPLWNQVNLHKELKKRLSLACLTENDANLAGLGEYWIGSGQGSKMLICLTLGTGVGGAVVQEGQLLKGARGLAGELGHMVIDPLGPVCGCGANGCFETLASGTSIQRTTGLGAKEVFERAQNGDRNSLRVFHDLGTHLGLGISSLAQIFDPDVVVIGGQVSRAWDLFHPRLKEVFIERMLRHPAKDTRVVPASCGNDAGILGAAYLVFDTYGESGTKNR